MINPIAYNSHKYGLIFTDEALYVRWGYLFKGKNEAFVYTKQFTALVETQYGCKIKSFWLDGGREYSLAQLKDLCNDIGATLKVTTLYSANQDGTSERSIRLILEKVRSVMIGMNIPAFLWPETFQSVIKIMNRTAILNLDDITPIEYFLDKIDPDHDHTPYLGHLRVLGCKSYVQIP